MGRGQVRIHGIDLGVGVGADDDGVHLVVIVLIGLDDVALAGRILVAVGGIGPQILAVVEHIGVAQHVAGGVVQAGIVRDQGRQVIVGVTHHVSGVGVVGVGAQLIAVIGPGGGGAAEVVGVVLGFQIPEVPLGELHQAVVLDVSVRAGAVGDVGVVALAGDGDVADSHGAVVAVLHHGGLQGVEGIQAGLLPGHGLGAHEVVVAVVQLDAHGLLDDVHGPVGAGVAFLVAVIAQGAQQHLHKGVAAQRVRGTERAVGIAADDALLRAVGDVARERVGGGHIHEGGGAGAQRVSSGGAQDQVADDLGGRTAGQGFVRAEGAVGIAVDDPHARNDGNRFLIGDVTVIVEVRGACADSDQRQGHRQSKHQ